MGRKESKAVVQTKNESSPAKEPNRQANAKPAQGDAKARSRAARNDLDCWLAQFRIGSLVLHTMDHCKREISYVRGVIRTLCQDDHLVSGRELERVARDVQDESPFSNYQPEICDKLIEELFNAAELEKDPLVSCPWKECLDTIGSQPRLFELGKTLWAKNEKGLREWRIDLDTLKAEVWGNEDRSTSTVRSLISEFQNQLKKQNIPLSIKVSDTRDNRWVRCVLPDDFDFVMSW